MRILFCSQASLSRERGGSKVVIELAEEMRQLGWSCELISPDEINPGGGRPYSPALRDYLQRHASAFDVIDYDHNHLPYPRDAFPPNCLFVARSVLLAHHFARIAIPDPSGLKSWLRSVALRRREKRQRAERILQAHETVVQADLVSVANTEDKTELVRCGIPPDKVVVIPYGIARDRRPLFDALPIAVPPSPLIGFVGTFDARKGATDMPAIARAVCAAVPAARFRFMGVLEDSDRLVRAMPPQVRSRTEVFPRYASSELPELLAPCSVGIFPSYIEAFGFGVLEMLAAAVPVIAYDSPGPPMMLPRDWLVRRGDVAAMSALVIELLRNRDKLLSARSLARERSRPFHWSGIARTTAETYERGWRLRNAHQPASEPRPA